MNPLEFLNFYCNFLDPKNVWILTGLTRNKDAENNPKFLQRKVLTKPSDIEEAYFDLKSSAVEDGAYRMYVSLNARNVIKTAFSFQRKLLDIGEGLANGRPDTLELAKKIGSLWKSELAQTCNRGTKRFLLDFDGPINEGCLNRVLALVGSDGKLVCQRKTPSGVHVVIEACDTRPLESECDSSGQKMEVHRDSWVFVDYWTVKT